jgi:rhamnosyl/mannosyltransferase
VEGRGLAHPRRGRLSYYKGFETLVHAVLGDPTKELAIIGEGEERPRSSACSRRPASPRTCGCWASSTTMPVRRYMASCDVLALPSRERTEAFGIVLLEAMRYEKPLSRATLAGSGVTWVARNGQNAMLVRPRTCSHGAARSSTCMRIPAQRAVMGQLGRQRYEREFDIARISRAHHQALRPRAARRDGERGRASRSTRAALSRRAPTQADGAAASWW